MASLQLSGYQCEFVESVKDYECPLCLHVTQELSLTSCCGQHFCQACIQKIFTDNKPCPLCKESRFTVFLDKKQRRRVLDLKVYCDKKADGCDWVGGLGELEQHLGENCQLVSVDCLYNCKKSFIRRRLEIHVMFDCPKRPHSCKHCNLKGTYQEIQDDHLPVCPKYPVECPNECEVAPLERGQLEWHLRECPLAMVECELKELGCEEVVQRKDTDKHMEQAAQKHLKLSTSYFITNQRKQDGAIAKLQEENIKLKQYHREQQANPIAKSIRECKAIKQELDIFKRHVGINSFNMTLDYMNEKETDRRWTNSELFHTVPTGYLMRVNLFFNSTCTLDFELTPMKNSRANDNLLWPKTFTMTVTMLNQTGDHSHYHDTKDLVVTREQYNDDIQIDYDTIDNAPPGVNYIQAIYGLVRFQIILTEKQ